MLRFTRFLQVAGLLLLYTSLTAQTRTAIHDKQFELINAGSGINNFPIQLTVMHQDAKGFLWLGSDFGVYRFDGRTVEQIRDNSETIMSVLGFMELGNDSMLIATEFGLGLYANGVIDKIRNDSTEVTSVVLKYKNSILIGTIKGLFEWQHGAVRLVPGTEKWHISSALVTPDDELLVYTDKGIFSSTGNGFSLKVKTSTPTGRIFATTGKELYYTDSVLMTLTGKPLNGEEVFEDVTSFCETNDMIFLVNAGEVRYRNKNAATWTSPEIKTDMGGAVQLYKDRSGTIWVLSHFGLSVLQPRSIEYSNNMEGGQIFYQHFRDSLTRIVFNNKSGTDFLVKENGRTFSFWKKFRPEDDPNAIASNVFSGLLFTRKEECYLSYVRGEKYYYCYGNKAVAVPFAERLLVSGVVEDPKNGDVWIQTTVGPAKASGTSVKLYSANNGYNLRKQSSISKVLPDPVGDWLWVGGDKSILAFLDLRTGRYTYMDSVWGIDPFNTRNLWIADIDADPAGNIWIYIMNRGLYQVKRNGNDPARFTCQLWDPDAPLGKYMFDGEGNLWAITIDVKARIYRAGKDKQLISPRIFKEIHLNKDLKEAQSLTIGSFRFNSGFSPGEFSLISTNNVYTFNTQTLFPQINHENAPLLTAVLINRKRLLIGDARFKYDVSGLPVTPILEYTENKIGFEFSALYTCLNNMVLFRYKLSDYEKDWQPADKKGFIEYTNLPPGDYRFILECSYDGQQWSDPVIYTFHIKTPWWETIWFSLLLFLLLAGLIWGLYRWRVRKLQNKASQLESLVRSRTSQLEEAMKNLEMRTDQHAMLLRVIAHDIKGPVRFIAEVSENLFLKWGVLEENEKIEFGQEIKRSTRTLYSFLSDFLLWLNLRPDNRLETNEISIGTLLNSVVKFHTESGNIRDNQLHVTDLGDKKDLLVNTNSKYLEIILNNLVDNACKHTRHGEIWLTVSEEKEVIRFTCRDTGTGMNPETVRQLENLKHTPMLASDTGTGLGYRFIYSLAGMIHAEVLITSELNAGTSVEIILPKHRTG